MSTDNVLPAIEIATGATPDASLIFLHGLGDSGHGWSDVVPALGLPSSLALRCIFPHAPEMPVTLNRGYVMPAWYDLYEGDFSARADLDGARLSRQHVEALIARERTRGVASDRIVLGGFSQGGAVALYAGVRHADRLAGVAALSTYLIDGDALTREASPANRDVPIFMAHGTEDPVVQYAWGEGSAKTLQAHGWPVEWHSYRMPHSAVLEEIQALGTFIARVLGPRGGSPSSGVGEKTP